MPPAQLPERLLVVGPLRVQLLRVRPLELLHLLEQGFAQFLVFQGEGYALLLCKVALLRQLRLHLRVRLRAV